MQNCPKCSAQIADNATFCSECGAKLSLYQDARNNCDTGSSSSRRLHCPHCKSTAITPMVETVGALGGTTRVTKRFSVTNTAIENKTSWMCRNCGKRFENIEELEAEITRLEGSSKLTHMFLMGAFIFFAVIGLISFLSPARRELGVMLLLIFGIAIILEKKFGTKRFVKTINKKKEYCVWLKQNCFD